MQQFRNYYILKKEELDICSLIRSLYASIDLSEVSGYELANSELATEQELDFLRSIMSSNNDNIKKVLRKLQSNQIELISKQAATMEQVTFARGTLNGLALVEEELDRLSSLYRKLSAKREAYDKHDLL